MEALKSLIESLGIEWPIVFAQALSFLLLLVVLWRFLYKPVGNVLRQREEEIANSIASAEAHKLQAESLRQEYEAHLARIADEARERLEQATKDAEAARTRMLADAQQEVRDLHERGRAQLELEREQLRRDLRNEMADVAVLAATKALRGNLTAQIQEAVANQVITELNEAPNAGA